VSRRVCACPSRGKGQGRVDMGVFRESGWLPLSPSTAPGCRCRWLCPVAHYNPPFISSPLPPPSGPPNRRRNGSGGPGGIPKGGTPKLGTTPSIGLGGGVSLFLGTVLTAGGGGAGAGSGGASGPGAPSATPGGIGEPFSLANIKGRPVRNLHSYLAATMEADGFGKEFEVGPGGKPVPSARPPSGVLILASNCLSPLSTPHSPSSWSWG